MSQDVLTVLTTRASDLLATKTFTQTPDGIAKKSYGNAATFTHTALPVDSIDTLHAALTSLASDPRSFVIRAKPIDASKTVVRRRIHESDGIAPDFAPEARHWLHIDIDGVPLPDGLTDEDVKRDAAAVVAQAVQDYLPSYLHGVTFSYQLSSSMLVTTSGELRVHVWFWLDRALDDEALKHWARRVNANWQGDGVLIDEAVYRAVQPNYVATPIFDGLQDPCKGFRQGLVRQPCDVASIPPSECEAPKTHERASYRPKDYEHAFSNATDLLEQALAYFDPNNYDTWAWVGLALKGNDDGQGLAAWHKWSARSPKYDPQVVDRKWQALTPTTITRGSIFYEAKQLGWQPPTKEARVKMQKDALEQALAWHKSTIPTHTASESTYLVNKQVAAFFDTHHVVGVGERKKGLMTSAGADLDGVRFGEDTQGRFLQVVAQDVSGAVSGFLRVYDDRANTFTGNTHGAFVLLAPDGVTSLRDAFNQGYELGVCTSLASGMSICMAMPKTVMLCALNAGNIAAVVASLRDTFGYRKKGKAVKVTIFADNDAWKDRNTGLTKAHKAALEYHCYVRAPNWQHRTLKGAKPTDFNDLHVLFGLGAVRRSRKHKPDPRLAFAEDLAKLKASDDKHMPAFELPEVGQALCVKSPMETGKTHQLASAVSRAKAQGLNVLVVVHRESLADSLAARLGLENYNDYKALDLAYINGGLVVCFDSLYKLRLTGNLPAYDLLVFDECEQITRHTTEAHIKNKHANFAVLRDLLKATPRIIGLDAHAGAAWLELLRRFAPDKQVTWHKHHHYVGQDRKVRLVFDKDDALDAFEQSNVPTWTATDSLKLSRDMAAYYGDEDTLSINSETSSTDAVQAYFADPTGQARQYQRNITTPSVQTGLSDESGHWRHVIGMFCNMHGTPQDRAQALMRARGVDRLTVWTDPRRRKAKKQDDLLREYAEADKAEAALAETGDTFASYDRDYLALKALVKARASQQNAKAKTNLAKELTLLGFDVDLELPEDIDRDTAKARKERREAMKAAGLDKYVQDRVQARRIDDITAMRLDAAHRLSQDDLLALQQWRVRDFYRLPEDIDDEDLARWLREDNYGQLRKQVTRYESMLKPLDVAKHQALEHRQSDTPLQGDAKHHLLEHDFGQRLAALVGLTDEAEDKAHAWAVEYEAVKGERDALQDRLDATEAPRVKGDLQRQLDALDKQLRDLESVTLEHTYNAQDAKDFARWCIAKRDALARVLGDMPTGEQLRGDYLLAHVGGWLSAAGLTQRSQGERKERSYALTLSCIYRMSKTSRPRRDKWQIAHNSLSNNPYKELCENGQKARPTRHVLDVGKNQVKVQDALQVPTPAPKPEDVQSNWQADLHNFINNAARHGVLPMATQRKLQDARELALAGDEAMVLHLQSYLAKPDVQAWIPRE